MTAPGTGAARRAGTAAMLVLLAAVPLAMLAPADPGAVRVAGVGALWWYAGLVAPMLAVVPLLVAGPGVPAARAAAWTSPSLFVAVGAAVFAGAADAPALTVGALLAPLLALVAPGAGPPPAPGPPGPATAEALAGAAVLGLLLRADLLLLADAGEALGLARLPVVGGGAAVLLLATASRGTGVPRLAALGAAGLALLAVGVGGLAGAAPWAAWRETASRPAFTFTRTSPWVAEGGRLRRAVSLPFAEPHHVTVLSPGLFGVVEPGVRRQWRVAPGGALALRPGDRLEADAGARLRFEAGKRVPGAPPSGPAWADPPARAGAGAALGALGLLGTLAGGAWTLLARPGAGGRGGPLLLLVFALGAPCWGIYAAHVAPDLVLGAPGAGLLTLPARLVESPWGAALAWAAILALALLAVGHAPAVAGALGMRPGLTRAALVLAAAASSLAPADAGAALLAGLGLAAAACAAPALARAGRAATRAGVVAGGAAWVALALAADGLPGWAAVAGAYPALVAAPLGWAVARAWPVAAPERD